MKQARERNPLGIGVGDIVKWGAIGIAGFWILDKIGGSNLNPLANLGIGGGDGPRAQIVSVSHPPLPPNGTAISIEWTINHKGPAERLRVGLAIAFGIPPLGVNFAQRMEADLYVGDDPRWASYQTGATYVVNYATIGGPFFYAYINDSRGARITERAV